MESNSMRELTDHKVNLANDKIKIVVMDEPGPGGAHHHYEVTLPDWTRAPISEPTHGIWDIQFQNGPIGEVGVNGITHEALLAILVDRMRGFQAGPYACRENALALTKLEEAQHWLNSRTKDRTARGVEGTHKR